ncbi:extracellular tyrosine-protein kinase PKDCC [Ditylenchus destructor]|uniref:Extracellular tyrosine-protein kinase PKDCC n=1 Tax=Ditylenchus destructor TaxID=166010 RepID=A0AAD4MMN7_9BILA|nr:extracellular tyrosine-protein kinase PKDCC [Ditylenchus destructor]
MNVASLEEATCKGHAFGVVMANLPAVDVCDGWILKPFLPRLILQDNEYRYENTPDILANCSTATLREFQKFPLARVELNKNIGNGWTKSVYAIDNDTVIKTFELKGSSARECFKSVDEEPIQTTRCIENLAQGFISEIGVLLMLKDDPNVPLLFGYCIPKEYQTDLHKLILMESRGSTPIDTIQLLQMSWKRRVQLVADILEFVKRIWPLQLRDFRRQQFVLSRDDFRPLYVDFDDVDLAKPCMELNTKGLAGSESCDLFLGDDTEYSRRIARRIYDDFSKDFFWYGRKLESALQLEELKDIYNKNELNLDKFQEIVDKLLSV